MLLKLCTVTQLIFSLKVTTPLTMIGLRSSCYYCTLILRDLSKKLENMSSCALLCSSLRNVTHRSLRDIPKTAAKETNQLQ